MSGQSTENATGQPRAGKRSATRAATGEVAAAVARDLEELAKRDPSIKKTAHAAIALSLARLVDDPGNSATSKSMNFDRLMEALEKLAALVPPRQEASPLDEIRARREARLRAMP